MSSFVLKSFVSAALLGVSMSAMAGSASELPVADHGAQGFYAGFDFSYAPISGSSSITGANAFGMGGHGGYAINRWVAVEASFDMLTNIKAGVTDISASVISASVVGFYPVKDQVDVFGKIGMGSANVGTSNWSSNVNYSKSVVTWGLGVEFAHESAHPVRIGMDHLDLSAWSALPISANNFYARFDFRF